MNKNEILNPLDYTDNPAEYELQKELQRLGIENDAHPGQFCPDCGSELQWGSGMAGESMAFCPNEDCNYGWSDNEQAIRNVY